VASIGLIGIPPIWLLSSFFFSSLFVLFFIFIFIFLHFSPCYLETKFLHALALVIYETDVLDYDLHTSTDKYFGFGVTGVQVAETIVTLAGNSTGFNRI
jgi:hypothetical protein